MTVDDIHGCRPTTKKDKFLRDAFDNEDIDGNRPKKMIERKNTLHDQIYLDVSVKKKLNREEHDP